MTDVNKDELYKILDLVNLLNNRVVNLLERVNKNSSNNKYQLPVINKTEVKKTQVKKNRGIILKKNVREIIGQKSQNGYNSLVTLI